MDPTSVRARIAPVLLQDYDAVWDEFVLETGRTDPLAFVAHLQEWDLVPAELADELLASLAAPDEPSEEGGATPTTAEHERGARRARFRKVTGGLRQTGTAIDAGSRPRRASGLPVDPRGRYEFVGTVGEGAMGRVHLARDRSLRRRVAYKEMTEEILDQPVLASRFQAEARITAQLDHPGIVPVYSLEGERAYTMRLVEGRTLAGLLAEARAAREARRPVPEAASRERLLELFVAVCDTVAYAHARGVLHRDLKPDNVMVGAFGEVYVMDWGIARVIDPGVEHPVDVGVVEDEGELVVGTPGHMSPEQANGLNRELDARSDQYALGLVLFEILTLRPAVTGKTALALVTRQQEGELDPFVHAFGDRIPRELQAVTRRALAERPDDRYPDLSALADDVRRALRGEPVTARPEGPVARVARALARHREATLLALLVLVLGTLLTAGAGVAFATWQASRASAREQAMTALLTTAARQASVAEGQLLKLQGLLSVVTTTAADALRQAPPPGTREGWYLSDFASAATAPPDAEEQEAGTKYGPGLVSPRHPVWLVAPGASREALRPRALALFPTLDRHLPTVLLRSHDEARATVSGGLLRRTVLEVQIPARWIWVALDEGLYGSYPGHTGWPEGFDFHQTDAWRRGHESRAPRWGPPALHPSGRAPVLTVTQALVDEHDQVVGAAGVDIGLDWVVENLLLPRELREEGVEAFLLDGEGRVMVDGSAQVLEPRTLDAPDVVEAIREKRSGAREEGDGIVLFHRLSSNGWYHVVRGPASSLLP